ncbi:MAG: ArpU family phage packaging/lysis transcriptional regulator [Lactobacillaceae bacterium]
MFLFRQVDMKRTEQNVLEFFSDDYRRLCSMAGANLQSPVLSATPAAKSVRNSQEDKFIKLIENRKILEAVNRSIKACSHDSQIIIKDRIISGYELYRIMPKLNISSYGKFYKLQTVACNEFADAFEVQAEPFFSNNENNLHIYKKPKS